MSNSKILCCNRCGGKLRFQKLVKGYVVAVCVNEVCGAEVRFQTSGTRSAYLTYVDDPVEFMRRFQRQPNAPADDPEEYLPMLPEDARAMYAAVRSLGLNCVRDVCEMATAGRDMARSLLTYMESGVESDGIGDCDVLLSHYGDRLRRLAGGQRG